ncbi:LETM1 domain-containing protein ylh47 [Tilletia horrida]|uniref:Mitochondrial proton/calcium exchanger protein n=1 Tax=Tilletia horrida TaxID=155126 RepID=A0AAN6JHR7_9BASI|nr:LETM1 domain-containing protein ylh47 [Tilletia horrida]
MPSSAGSLRQRSLALASESLLNAARVRMSTPHIAATAGASALTQADVMRLFSAATAASATQPVPAAGRRAMHTVSVRRPPRPTYAPLSLVRQYSTGVQEDRSSSKTPVNAPPPASSTSSSSRPAPKTTPSPSSPSRPSPSTPYQQAGEPPRAPSVSTANLAKPVSGTTGAELGSASNQTSASQAQLAQSGGANTSALGKLADAAADASKGAKELTEAAGASVPTESEKGPKPSLPVRIWHKVKEEAQHYWHGSKLLAKEVSISARLLRRLMLGYNLTRREHRQLRRTTGDLLRLIPFVPFIIIPAGELLLPVAIKIFPNMLPSTFESKFAVEEKRRRLIKVRLEMAKFLQETIRQGGLNPTDKIRTSSEFKEFFRKVRSTGEKPSPEDVIKVARLFDDELTLDNLSRPQLVSICRYMQINAFGTDNYLRFQIRHKLNQIKQDDMVIRMEGIDKLSIQEVQNACQSRGIQTQGVEEDILRTELEQWIDLHTRQKISGTLLILSKAFNYVAARDVDGNKSSHIQSLEITLSSLPDNLLNETELQVNQEQATNKQRLEVLQQQEELIEDEAEQEQEEREARELEKERKKATEELRIAREAEDAKALLPRDETSPEAAQDDVRMTNEQLHELGEALSILSAKSAVLKEREELDAIYREAKFDSTSNSGLAKRLRSLFEKIDHQIEDYDRDVGSRMNLIQTSATGKISVDDLEQALRLIKHRPPDEVLEKLVDKLDVDHDGLIPLDHVIELAREETGLGILREDDPMRDIQAQGQELRGDVKPEPQKPKKEDIVE